jgi:hypothetical protein
MTGLVFGRLGIKDGVVLRLVETGMEGRPCGVDVMKIDRRSDLGELADLTQAEGTRLLARVPSRSSCLCRRQAAHPAPLARGQTCRHAYEKRIAQRLGGQQELELVMPSLPNA